MAGRSVAEQETRGVLSRVGFIGLGIMGRPMAHNLLRAGLDLVVHSRSRAPVDELVAAGALRAESPREVAGLAQTVVIMVPDTPDLNAVVDGGDGLLEAMHPPALVIDMSTVDPIETRAIAARFSERGIGYVDAPVSGGEKGAIEGKLSIMAGGSVDDFQRALPILEILGATIVHVGEVGAGQVTKAANQLVVGVTIEAVAEALALADAAGVDPVKVREALLGGFAASRILEVHGQRMLEGTYKPGFRSRLHLKDARIASQTARHLGVSTPALDVAEAQLASLTTTGRGDLDHAALYLLVKERPD